MKARARAGSTGPVAVTRIGGMVWILRMQGSSAGAAAAALRGAFREAIDCHASDVVVDLGAAARIGVEMASTLGAMADAMSSRKGALWIAAAWSDHAGYTLRPIQEPAPAGLLGICPALDRALDELIAADPAGSPFESFETTTAA